MERTELSVILYSCFLSYQVNSLRGAGLFFNPPPVPDIRTRIFFMLKSEDVTYLFKEKTFESYGAF